MKIYAITDGEYSAYHIEQITTDPKIAEAYAKLHNFYVEEYDELSDISVIETAKELKPYIWVRSESFKFSDWKEVLEARIKREINYEWYLPEKAPTPCLGYRDECHMCIQIKDDLDLDNIPKIVYDTRAKLIAEKEGIV